MNTKSKLCKLLPIISTLILLTLVSINPSNLISQSSPGLTITATVDQSRYILRQPVSIMGDILLDGSPADDLVVVTQVNEPRYSNPIAYRTLQVGNPNQPWLVEISELYVQDPNTNQPIDTVKPGTSVKIGINVTNIQLSPLSSVAARITVFDAAMTPIGVVRQQFSLDPGDSAIAWDSQFYIPKWAHPGYALIVGCAYNQEPKDGGTALCIEKTYFFYISRAPPYSGLNGYPEPLPPIAQGAGSYSTSVRMSPTPWPGNYSVYVLGQFSQAVKSSAITTFDVLNVSGYPPQASFAYWPAPPYINQTVNFDASSSTAEGYVGGSDDRITRIEWDFGDGTPKVIKTGNPVDTTATHTYLQNNTYIVALNVTDNEGLWCTTSKPVKVQLDYPPTARFTWAPNSPYNGTDVATFNATTSTPGWSSNSNSYPPIQNYTWNFGESPTNYTETSPTKNYIFLNIGDWTVTLTVTDTEGRSNSVSHIVTVRNQSTTGKIYDVVQDGIIDVQDVYRVGKAYGSWGPDGFNWTEPGLPAASNWDEACDIAPQPRDNYIDISDYYLVSRHYGEDP